MFTELIFTAWIRLLRQLLGHALVARLPSEASNSTKFTYVFKKVGYLNCVILQCAKVFAVRSQYLDNQGCK